LISPLSGPAKKPIRSRSVSQDNQPKRQVEGSRGFVVNPGALFERDGDSAICGKQHSGARRQENKQRAG
jgi:hypothetical protein